MTPHAELPFIELRGWLVRQGFPPDGVDAVVANDTTPLMTASRQGDAAAVNALIGAGAKQNARNRDGNNALWFACVAASDAVIDLLLTAGVDIDNRNDNLATCLMYAASAGKAAVVARLLQAGAAVQHETLDGFTALDMAATIECLHLLRRGAPPSGTTASRAGRC